MSRRALGLIVAATVPLLLGEGASAARKPRPRRARTPPVVRRMPPLPAVVTAPDASDRDRVVAEACRRGLAGVGGSAVAMDPRTGRVIAVVNPTLGVGSAYQPCSVFKIVVGLAGLSEGVIRPDTLIPCQGGCWMWPGHGSVDLRRALAVSCNPFFERVGERLGYERIRRYAELLGLNAPSGVNLEGESPGRMPSAVSLGAVGHMSSHAAGIATSPLQLAVLLSATINGGIVFRPQVAGPAGYVPRERWRLPAGTSYAGLAEGFLGAVNEGSAADAFDPEVIVAGKTGTCAGVGWFASYAPADKPEVVIVVFLRPGSGHLASAAGGRIYQELYRPPVVSTSAGGGS